MIKLILKFSFSIIIAGCIASCESTTTPPVVTKVVDTTIVSARDRAVFVVSEGANANGSLDVVLFHKLVSVHDSATKSDTTVTVDTIFHTRVLDHLGLGNDIVINGNRAYVLDVFGSTISVIDADSLKAIAAISFPSTNQPNKIALIGTNLLLVTERANTSAAIVDLSTNTIADSVVIGEPSYALAVVGGKAYVTSGATSYAGPFHVSTIDLTTRKVTARVTVSGSPEQAIADSANGQAIVGCSSVDFKIQKPRLYYFQPASNATPDSLIFGVDGNTDGEMITGPQPMLLIGGDVMKLGGTTHQLGATVLHTGKSFYKGAYDATKDEIYLGVSDFTSASGKVEVYNASSGAFKWSFTTGIAPAHFAFYH